MDDGVLVNFRSDRMATAEGGTARGLGLTSPRTMSGVGSNSLTPGLRSTCREASNASSAGSYCWTLLIPHSTAEEGMAWLAFFSHSTARSPSECGPTKSQNASNTASRRTPEAIT